MRHSGARFSLLPLLAAGIFLLSPPSFAGDPDFDSLVRSVETNYRTRRIRIPFFGLANFMVKVVRPAGARGISLAIFEDLDRSGGGEADGFDFIVRGAVSPSWQPLIRVRSRRGKESTWIYGREQGSNAHILIATRESDDAVIMQVKLKPSALAKWIDERAGRPHRRTTSLPRSPHPRRASEH